MRALSFVLSLVMILGCRSNAQPASPAKAFVAGTRTTKTPEVASWVFKGDRVQGWEDHGWDARQPRKSGDPERHLMGNYGGWILAKSGFEGLFGGLTMRVRTTPQASEFLELNLDSEKADIFPRVMLRPEHRVDLADGWSEIYVSMSELNPTLAQFDHVRLRAVRPLPPPGLVEIDFVGLTGADAALLTQAEAARNAPGTMAAFAVDCEAPVQEISPLIYSIAFDPMHDGKETHQWKLNAASRRWGGNPASRYNWELGNAWNTGLDYFFENVDYVDEPGFTWRNYLDANRDRHVVSAVTLPMLGWVARDTKSVSFPRSEYPVQQAFDGYRTIAGNGLGKDGKPLKPGPPARTSIAAPPDFIARWVKTLRDYEAVRGKTAEIFFLDNEPALWHSTHRDVHPAPLSYDEQLSRTVEYASAVRKVAPDALLAGPAEWGWPGYFYSAVDAEAGFMLRPDRRAHGDVPLLEWWLGKLAAHEKKTGVRLLDVLDLHFYPQAQGMGVGTEGQTDGESAALRIRSTRALWDPRYTDESWIKEPVRLIPRMRELVQKNYPGLKLAIGEYNFGAERHLSGGLALAEALGRFGQEGLYAAWYWTYPVDASPAFWAFRAFRNYDGAGGRFADWSMPTTTAQPDASLFAARSKDGSRVTLVALNLSPKETLEASIKLQGCTPAVSQRVFSYIGDARGFSPRQVPLGSAYRLPPYSITVIELTVPRPK